MREAQEAPGRVSMKKASALIVSTLAGLAAVPGALAHCPVCTAATGAAVAVGRVYGVPDSIMGVFIGAFALSTGLWLNNFLKKKGYAHPGQAWMLGFASIILTIIGLHIGNLFHNSTTLLGMSSLLAGILIGSTANAFAYGVHTIARHYHNNKNHLPLQGFIAVLATLIITVFVMGALT